MRKIITVTALILILTLSIATSVLAINSITANKGADSSSEYANPSYAENAAEDKTKFFDVSRIDNSASENVISYSASKTVSNGYSIDIYNDSFGNEYLYSSSDEMVGYRRGNSLHNNSVLENSLTAHEDINSETVVSLAQEFANNLLGTAFSGFVLEEVIDTGAKYYVLFELPAGEGGFIHARRCSVRVSSDGVIGSCILSQKTYPDDFDLTCLSDIRESDVTANVEHQLTELFSDARGIVITDVYIENGGSLLAKAEFSTDLAVTEEVSSEYDIYLLDGNRFGISVSYPLS